MTDIIYLKLSLAGIIFLLTIFAGWYPFRTHRITSIQPAFPRGESLACGVFLGAGLLHMLSHAANDFNGLGYQYPLAYLIVGATFLIFLLIEHIGRELHQHHASDKAFAIIALVMLSIHSLLSGAALGLSGNFYIVMTLFFAIIAHKWAESFALSVRLNRSFHSIKPTFLIFIIFTLMTPIGIIIGDVAATQFGHHALFAPIFESLAAGTFLYLGTLHGLERAVMVKECCDLKNYNFVMIGFSIMALVAIWN